jgi:linoleoyl-CoA desaturase
MPIPRYSYKPEFYNDLRERVQQYFEETKQDQTGNWRLFSKAIVIVALHILFYTILVFFTPNVWLALLFCVVLGLTTAAIGFNIMHDGSHGSFSKYKILNQAAAFSLNILGGSDLMWRVKHCMLHHTFTNVDGVDDDIEFTPIMRMCKTQAYYWWHRFQFIYVVFLYAIFYFFWLFLFDYKKYFTRKIGDFEMPKLSIGQHLYFWLSKIGCYFILIVLPIMQVGTFNFLIGFTVFVLVTGFVVSIVFQLAHTVEHTDFPEVTDEGKIENEWAIHQVQTTANFATRSRFVTWFCGGLNFQIEHHLFPKISHIHYPKISKIVKDTCAEYGLVYIEFPRFHNAVASHWRLLRELGKA